MFVEIQCEYAYVDDIEKAYSGAPFAFNSKDKATFLVTGSCAS